MANTTLVAVGTGLVAAAFGVAGGIFIGKNFFEQKAQDKAEEEIAKMKAYYQDNRKDVATVESDALELTKQEAKARRYYQEKYEEIHTQYEELKSKEQVYISMMYKEGLDVPTLLEHIQDYQQNTLTDTSVTEIPIQKKKDYVVVHDDEYESDGSESDESEEDIEVTEEDETSNVDPYLIDDSFFDEEDDLYSKLSYSWYAKDKVLADESNAPFLGRKNYEKIVGSEFLNYISEETPIIYVRNERLMTDYEISYKPCTYGDSLA